MGVLMSIVDRLCGIYGLTAASVVSHDVILCYHTVQNKDKPLRGWLSRERSIDVKLFCAQMRWLRESVEVVTINEMLSGRPSGCGVRVAVTFDDGYFDNINVVKPVLKELKIPMTWFVATEYVDKPNILPWWDLIDFALEKCVEPLEFSEKDIAGVYDPLKSDQRQWLNESLRNILKSSEPEKRDVIVSELVDVIQQQVALPPNSFSRAEEITAALDDGLIELGGHTVTHPNVALCSELDLKEELQRNKMRLEKISGRPVNYFAYPFGGEGAFNKSSAQAVRIAGFAGALTLVSGTVNGKQDRFKIPRIPVSPKVSMTAFKGRVLGAPLFSSLDYVRRRFRPVRYG